jgi:hypothetical protein
MRAPSRTPPPTWVVAGVAASSFSSSREVVAVAERGVEVDEVQRAEAHRPPALGDGDGVGERDALVLGAAAHELDAAASAEVDGGCGDHDVAPAPRAAQISSTCATKFQMIRRPAWELFSGWNWRPQLLPFRTPAAKRPPPYSDQAIASSGSLRDADVRVRVIGDERADALEDRVGGGLDVVPPHLRDDGRVEHLDPAGDEADAVALGLVRRSNRSCMPRQMPRQGSPAWSASRMGSRSAGSAAAAWPNAPTPGSTRASSARAWSQSAVTSTVAPAASSALPSECRLPAP